MNKKEEKRSINYINYVLVGLLVVAAFVIGSLYTKNKALEQGSALGAQQNPKDAAGGEQQNTAPKPSPITLDKIKEAFNSSLIKFGDTNKKLILIDISDPSCPYCQIAAGHNPNLNKEAGAQFTLVADGGTYIAPVPEMKKLVDTGRASYAFLYTPGHGNGEMGAKALYCAFDLGKYWEVHDKLMSAEGYSLMNEKVKNDKSKSKDIADFLANEANSADIQKCLDSGKYDDRLQKDRTLASNLGVQGTPGFFVNTVVFAGAYSFKDMQSAVDNALK